MFPNNHLGYSMKRNLYKKILAVFCALLIFSLTPLSALASESSLSALSFNNALSSINVTYSKDGNTIIETTTLIDTDGEAATISRTINPDGTGRLITHKGNSQTETNLQGQDYTAFEKIADAKPIVQTRSGTVGKDITGSQYKHVKLGSTSSTINNSTIDQIKVNGVTFLVSTLIGLLNTPAGVAAGLASYIYSSILSLSPAKMVISQTSYEVRFTYDNEYYIHCYHQTCKSYDASGKLIDTTTYYNQAIGG